MFLSLSSYGSGVGKDTVAEILVRKYGFVQFSWASELRRYIACGFPDAPYHYRDNTPHIIPDKDWEEKVGFGDALRAEPQEVRDIVFKNNKLILKTMCDGRNPKIVVSDTRFLREFSHLQSLGFEMVKVLGHPRRGIKSEDDYLNLCPFDAFLNNFCSLGQLENNINNYINGYVKLTRKNPITIRT